MRLLSRVLDGWESAARGGEAREILCVLIFLLEIWLTNNVMVPSLDAFNPPGVMNSLNPLDFRSNVELVEFFSLPI